LRAGCDAVLLSWRMAAQRGAAVPRQARMAPARMAPARMAPAREGDAGEGDAGEGDAGERGDGVGGGLEVRARRRELQTRRQRVSEAGVGGQRDAV
jgi:hypothetical protein